MTSLVLLLLLAFVVQLIHHADAALCPSSAPLCHPERLTARAPEQYTVLFITTQGEFEIEVTRAWAPHGADRVWNLVRAGFYDNTRFYRVLPTWVCQWGVNGDPSVSDAWKDATIPDDPVRASNLPGTVAFSAAYNAAKSWATNRTTELYINYQNNSRLDHIGFAPFGVVTRGMDVVRRFFSGYGEMCSTPGEHSWCSGHVIETTLYAEGNRYLKADFPKLDYAYAAVARASTPQPALLAPSAPSIPIVWVLAGLAAAVAVVVAVVWAVRAHRRRGQQAGGGGGGGGGGAAPRHVQLTEFDDDDTAAEA